MGHPAGFGHLRPTGYAARPLCEMPAFERLFNDSICPMAQGGGISTSAVNEGEFVVRGGQAALLRDARPGLPPLPRHLAASKSADCLADGLSSPAELRRYLSLGPSKATSR